MAYGPKLETLKDRDISRAQKIGLTDLHGAQAEGMRATAEQTRYKTGELERTEGLRTDIKEEELAGVKAQREKFEIMLNEFKASEPSRRAMENLGILKGETEYLQVSMLKDYIEKNPTEALTYISREIEMATYNKDVRAIHTRDATMYKMGSQILELMNQGRYGDANKMYEVAKEQFQEIEGKPLVDELGLPEQLNSDHISLIKGHVESAKMGTEWAQFALKREEDAAASERVHTKGAYDVAAAKGMGLDASKNLDRQDTLIAQIDKASETMFRFIAPHLTETMGASEGADNQFLPTSKNYGLSKTYHSTASALLQDAIKQNADDPAFNSEVAAKNIADMMQEDWIPSTNRDTKWGRGMISILPGDDNYDIMVPSVEMGQADFLKAFERDVGTMVKNDIDPQIAIDTFIAQKMAEYRDFKRKQQQQAYNKAIK